MKLTRSRLTSQTLRVVLVEAKEEATLKDAEIAKLKKAFQLRNDGVRHNNFLYDKGSDGQPVGQPYCIRREQIDGVMIKLTYDDGIMRGNAIAHSARQSIGMFRSIMKPQRRLYEWRSIQSPGSNDGRYRKRQLRMAMRHRPDHRFTSPAPRNEHTYDIAIQG
jgi:hypothetical protein